MSDEVLNNVPKCKEVEIYRLLNIIVSTEGETKQAAVEEVRRLKFNEEFLIHLTEIVSNSDLRSDVRLFASAELKNHIEAHWCFRVENFVGPEIHQTIKTKIKELLLTALSEPATQVREAVANIITTVLPWEWPRDWATLIETLVSCLNAENENGIHGALLVLNNFDLSRGGTYSMPDVPTILRAINRVFTSEHYSEEIRCLACKIFSRIVSDATQNKDPESIQRYLQPAVSSFCAAFVPNWTSGIGGSRLKVQILHTAGTLMGSVPKYLADFLPDMIHMVWKTLIDCAKDYQVNVVNRAERNGNEIESVADEEESFSTDLVKATLKWIKQLMNGRDRTTPCHNLHDHEWISLQDSFVPPHALRHLIMLMEIPDEKIEQWNTDADDFVEQEERQELEYDGIRRTAQEIIVIIGGQKRLVANNLIAEIMKYLEIERTMRLHGQTVICQKSWKSLEAFLLAFSLMKNNIISQKDGKRQRYNVQSILQSVVLAELNNPASRPLLVGRCLIVGEMYADQMSKKMAAAFLKATAAGLQENRQVYVKIHAAKAVLLWWCQNKLRETYSTILRPYVPNLFEGLFNLAEHYKSAGVHMLVVKSIASLMPIDTTYTASVASSIYSLTETALVQYHFHNSFHSVLTVFEELVLNPRCTPLLQQKLTPTLLGILTGTPSEKYNVAIDIVTVLVEHSTPPLRDLVNSTLFPAACSYVIRTDDWGLQYRGIKMIQKYLFVDSQEFIDCEAKYGQIGAQCIIQVISHALNHNTAMSKIEEIRDILILLIKEAHHKMEGGIDGLLGTLLKHMRNEKSIQNRRRILVVFAYLIRAQSNLVLNFLANTQGSSKPKNSLELIISKGFCTEYYRVGYDEQRIMKSAFGKILEYGVTNLSSPLHDITFRGLGLVIPVLARISQITT